MARYEDNPKSSFELDADQTNRQLNAAVEKDRPTANFKTYMIEDIFGYNKDKYQATLDGARAKSAQSKLLEKEANADYDLVGMRKKVEELRIAREGNLAKMEKMQSDLDLRNAESSYDISDEKLRRKEMQNKKISNALKKEREEIEAMKEVENYLDAGMKAMQEGKFGSATSVIGGAVNYFRDYKIAQKFYGTKGYDKQKKRILEKYGIDIGEQNDFSLIKQELQ